MRHAGGQGPGAGGRGPVAWAVVGSSLARLFKLAEPGPMVHGSVAAALSLVIHTTIAAVAGLVGFGGGKR